MMKIEIAGFQDAQERLTSQVLSNTTFNCLVNTKAGVSPTHLPSFFGRYCQPCSQYHYWAEATTSPFEQPAPYALSFSDTTPKKKKKMRGEFLTPTNRRRGRDTATAQQKKKIGGRKRRRMVPHAVTTAQSGERQRREGGGERGGRKKGRRACLEEQKPDV